MPDIVTHYHFSRRLLAALPPEEQARLGKDILAYAALGPDPWYSLHFYGGAKKELSVRGGIMQKEHTGAFLRALAAEARAAGEPRALLSYLAGFLCHYCLDKHCHPYILYKTGDYIQGRPETLPYRGNHSRLERAIDSFVIRRHYGKRPWHFPITKTVLGLKALPESLRDPLNRAHEAVYGWPAVFDDLNACLRDQKIFYWLMQDPLGLVDKLMPRIDNGRTHEDYRTLPYFHKDIDPAQCDYLNEKKAPWCHPCDESLVSTESFHELFDKALAEAVELVTLVLAYARGEAEDLSALGNASYETGFDCPDPRNFGPRHYAPLF